MTQKQLEREITKIYQQARDDIGRKWYDYFEKGSERLAEKEGDLRAARAAGNKAEADRLEKELIRDKRNFTEGNKYYKDMIKETTRQMANANQTAAAYVNNQLPSFYQQSFNEEMSAEAVQMGVRYDLADEATVARRIKDGDIELPARKVDIPKDQRWNTKQINANVTQGIIQGESMDKIAKRLEPIMDGNRKAAIRNARTLVNGAENQGRQDRYEDLEKQGAIMKKVWIATGDERTRDWHLEMDGQEVDIDEDFVDGNGNELEYPGDPKAAPETVYNCRCTMKSKIVGFKKADGTIINLKDYGGSELHKEEIRQEIERREQAKQQNDIIKEEDTRQEELHKEKESVYKEGVVDGKNITDEWERRWPEGTTAMQKAYHEVDPLFDYEIQDVINAQGFDGLPKVLYGEDFEKAVSEANNGNGFIAQRTYSAPSEEIAEQYAKQLRSGEWYVDCSAGGAQYGQGMYCAADYNGKLTIGIENEMSHYQSVGRMRGNPYSKTETLTLDPSAKIMRLPYGQDAYEYTSGKMADEYIRAEGMKLSGGERRATKELISIRTEAGKNYDDYLNKRISGQELLSKNDELSNRRNQLFNDYPAVKEINSQALENTRKFKDPGSMAAAMGYDAINAEGHGQSGSYTVILNRTKVILKGE